MLCEDWTGRIPGLRKSHPEDKDELEGVVEWEPVNGVDRRLDDCEKAKGDPVLHLKYQQIAKRRGHAQSTHGQPLRIIRLARREQRL
jgi:hypothetical protein